MNSPWTWMSFFFSVLSFFFKLWERERVYKIGYKEKRSQSLLNFFFWRSSCGEYFLKKWLLRVRDILFVFFYPEYLAFGSVRHEPCPTTNFSYYLFPLTGRSPHFRFGVPANHFAFTFFLPVLGDPSEVTEYKHLFLTVILWWLAPVNWNKRIVVIIFQSSQWDTTWHYVQEYFNYKKYKRYLNHKRHKNFFREWQIKDGGKNVLDVTRAF